MRCGLCTFCLTLLLTVVSGCGGSSGGTIGGGSQTYPTLTGNWMAASDSSLTNSIYELGGYMTNTGGSVTATLHAVPFLSSCFPSTDEIPFTGTVTTTGSISMTSTEVASQVISVTGTTVNGSLLSGSYKITGGCAGGDSGSLIGLVEPSYSGAYSGTFQTGAPSPVSVSVTMIQSGPDADGTYSLSGTVNFSGTSCFTTGTITSSTAYGGFIQFTVNTDQDGVLQFTGFSAATPQAITIEALYQVTAGLCSGETGDGSLSTPPSS